MWKKSMMRNMKHRSSLIFDEGGFVGINIISLNCPKPHICRMWSGGRNKLGSGRWREVYMGDQFLFLFTGNRQEKYSEQELAMLMYGENY